MAHVVKNLPAMQETWVRSLCQEDPLEKEMATHSSILAWRIPWTEEPGGLYSPWGSILKSRDITLLTKVCIVKAIVFPLAMCGWEIWTIKKAECQRIDAFEL